jgi:hypothetical protein
MAKRCLSYSLQNYQRLCGPVLRTRVLGSLEVLKHSQNSHDYLFVWTYYAYIVPNRFFVPRDSVCFRKTYDPLLILEATHVRRNYDRQHN